MLAPLPLSALRLPLGTVAGLARVGLKRIGDIIDLPRAPLTARFGIRAPAPARPRPGSRARAAQPAAAGRALCRRAALCRTDRARGRRARHRDRTAGAAAAIRAGAARRRRPPHRAHIIPHRRRGAPHRRRHLAAAARPETKSARCLSSGSPHSPMNSIPASASTWRGCPSWSPSPARPNRSALAAAKTRPNIDRLVDRLSARLGARRVRRLIAQDSHIPEIAAAAVPAQTVDGDAGWAAFRRLPRRSRTLRRARCGC